LILSDMEFDRCVDMTGFEAIKSLYAQSGYKLPKVVFWNLNARAGNNPVRVNQYGTALVSGFSPSILKALLNSPADFTPFNIMMNTLSNPRYNVGD
jgi:hypothetical protein